MEDKRESLPEGTILSFPGMDCMVEAVAGRGSNAIVYLGSYPDRQTPALRHRVLIKELFPYHPGGGIYRGADGDICQEPDAADTARLHRLSFMRGNEIHIRLLEKIPGDLDVNINTFALHNTLYSVLGFAGGRSLDKELEARGAAKTPLSVHIRRLLGALDVLEAFHREGFLHLDISPDNILLIGDGKRERVALIDYNSVHTLSEIGSGNAVYYSVKEGYTAPEVRAARTGDIGFSSDLYALTAVFYRCITGKCLTAAQAVRKSVPDFSGADCLDGAPETVRGMVKQIFRRGLAPLVSRRYQNVAQMRLDLEELQDRIDGKGITHWALWEAGRENVVRAVRTNHALDYIRDEEHLYPVTGTREDGSRISIGDLVGQIISPGGGSAVLLGGGGVGKTTALLRAAYAQPSSYSSSEPALTYLSLYGWRDGGDNYIKDKILEGLRFKPETDSLETARHELLRLLSSPAHTKRGERPWLLILLDGLNEASGDTSPLLKEICELAGMEGVRLLAAGRSEKDGIPLQKIRLCPLEPEDVSKILSEHGLLMPEEPEMGQLLRTPLMLSVFIRSASDGKNQVFIRSQEQLLAYYFEAIRSKAVRDLPDDSPDRWADEAALYYVLPEIAAFVREKGTAVSDEQLFPVIEKCYRRLSRKTMRKIFPQWIGHLSDIRGGALNAEEWYGYMVHEILWRRMGLIIRDENRRYRVVHEVIGEYLAGLEKPVARAFARSRNRRVLLSVLLGALPVLAFYRWIYIPFQASREEPKTPYDRNLAENVLDAAFSAYRQAADQYENLSAMICCLQKNKTDDYEVRLAGYLTGTGEVGISPEYAVGYLESLFASGEVMPWSGRELNEKSYEALVRIPQERSGEYSGYVSVMDAGRKDEALWNDMGEEYLEEFLDLLQSDARVLGRYYNDVIAPELEAMGESGQEKDRQALRRYEEVLEYFPNQNEISGGADASAQKYTAESKEAEHILRQNALNYKVREEQEDE